MNVLYYTIVCVLTGSQLLVEYVIVKLDDTKNKFKIRESK